MPSGRSLLAAFAILVAAAGGYWAAYASPLFAVAHVEVQGAPPAVAREVRGAVAGYLGRSLVAVDAGEVAGKVRALPTVAGVGVDRAFPNTIVVKVAPERPVAVARGREAAWLVTGAGDVIRRIAPGTERRLPRLWLPKRLTLRVGRPLPASFLPAGRALEAVLDAGLAHRVKGVRRQGRDLVLAPRRGPEILLGRPVDLRLKTTVAARVLPHLSDTATYLDVSVPERPVSDAS